MGILFGALAIAAVVLFVAVGMYNSLVSLRQRTMAAWGQIDVQLKRRYDLIPNMVETVKGYMAHEQGTLEKVIQARNSAMAAEGVHDKSVAESQLTRAISGFFALAESYPELKADAAMGQLQEELRATENKIAMARQYYNDTVTEYNTRLETFPSSLVASFGGFKSRELFELEEAEARDVVKVSF
jgi:LemA protein